MPHATAAAAMPPLLLLRRSRRPLRGARHYALLLVLLLTQGVGVAAAPAAPCNLEGFQAFCRQFHKNYTAPEEFARRWEAWTKSCLFLEQYKAEHPDAPFAMAMNPLSDRTPEEHQAMFGFKVLPRSSNATSRALQGFRRRDHDDDDDGLDQERDRDGFLVEPEWAKELEPRDLPPTVDWRMASLNPEGIVAVTPVKNQGACGACWAFTTVAATEGAVAVTTKVLNELSNQELIDCVDQGPGAGGCNGGDFHPAFSFVARRGLTSSADYRFLQQQSTCRAGESPMVSKISGARETSQCSTNGLMSIVATRPVAVAIDGSCDAFVNYGGGIYTQSCGNDLNHAVTIVGYDTDTKTGTRYWVRPFAFSLFHVTPTPFFFNLPPPPPNNTRCSLSFRGMSFDTHSFSTSPKQIIKNSWGKYWGTSGYGKVAMGIGTCGVSRIEEYGYYATGGTAYVNGTGFFSDDALNQDPNVGFLDRILKWEYLPYVLGIAIALLMLPLIMSFFRALRRCCCGSPGGSSSQKGRGGRRMNSPVNGAGVVVPLGSGGAGGRTLPSRSPGGGARSPPPSRSPGGGGGARSPPPRSPPPSAPPLPPAAMVGASEWSCPACTFLNAPTKTACAICGNKRR